MRVQLTGHAAQRQLLDPGKRSVEQPVANGEVADLDGGRRSPTGGGDCALVDRDRAQDLITKAYLDARANSSRPRRRTRAEPRPATTGATGSSRGAPYTAARKSARKC